MAAGSVMSWQMGAWACSITAAGIFAPGDSATRVASRHPHVLDGVLRCVGGDDGDAGEVPDRHTRGHSHGTSRVTGFRRSKRTEVSGRTPAPRSTRCCRHGIRRIPRRVVNRVVIVPGATEKSATSTVRVGAWARMPQVSGPSPRGNRSLLLGEGFQPPQVAPVELPGQLPTPGRRRHPSWSPLSHRGDRSGAGPGRRRRGGRWRGSPAGSRSIGSVSIVHLLDGMVGPGVLSSPGFILAFCLRHGDDRYGGRSR